jgi:hypothetical protein
LAPPLMAARCREAASRLPARPERRPAQRRRARLLASESWRRAPECRPVQQAREHAPDWVHPPSQPTQVRTKAELSLEHAPGLVHPPLQPTPARMKFLPVSVLPFPEHARASADPQSQPTRVRMKFRLMPVLPLLAHAQATADPPSRPTPARMKLRLMPVQPLPAHARATADPPSQARLAYTRARRVAVATDRRLLAAHSPAAMRVAPVARSELAWMQLLAARLARGAAGPALPVRVQPKPPGAVREPGPAQLLAATPQRERPQAWPERPRVPELEQG